MSVIKGRSQTTVNLTITPHHRRRSRVAQGKGPQNMECRDNIIDVPPPQSFCWLCYVHLCSIPFDIMLE